jgi:hypothetical protein
MTEERYVRVQLIGPRKSASRPIGSHVAFVAIVPCRPAPSVVVWNDRIFHRYAGACGPELRDGDVYRECSAVRGHEIE